LAFVALLASPTCRTAARATGPQGLLLVPVSASPLVHDARMSFSESLATLLIALLVVICLERRRPWPVLLAALLASLTKETAFPFVLAAGGAAVGGARTAARGRALIRGHLAGLVSGSVVAIAMPAGCDCLRFGQAIYTADVFSVPSSRSPSCRCRPRPTRGLRSSRR
jgi:hypothetical protein